MSERHQLLLKNVVLLIADQMTSNKLPHDSVDIRIRDGIVDAINPSLSGLTALASEKIIDCSGLLCFPGLIDMHTHLRDFSQSDAEDISSGTLAAAAGGYTTLVAMANTQPPIDNIGMLERLLNRIKAKAHVQVLPVAAVTEGLQGHNLTNMYELAQAGAIAFSDDGMPISNLAVLKRALEYAHLTERPIISHAEDKDLSNNGSMNESAKSLRLGLRGIPSASEAACVAREIEVLRYTGGRLHFAHVSTKAALNLIKQAKQDGLAVTAEVTPHHLVLTDEDIENYDPSYKMNPPLRSAIDREFLIACLKDGTIDAIATDHAPHTRSSKAKPFDQCPFGIIGLETAFALLYEHLILGQVISWSHLLILLTNGPAKILNLSKPTVKIGEKASLVLFAPKLKWSYNRSETFSKSSNSPFGHRELVGKIVMTIDSGRIVYETNLPALTHP